MNGYDFKALEDNLVYVATEALIKMGGNEPVGLYYPAATLISILGGVEKERLNCVLEDFASFVFDRLGEIGVEKSGDRYRITLGEKALDYARKGLGDCAFLKDLIEYSKTYPADMDGVTAIFKKYSDKVVCKPQQSEEFDFLVYFEDGAPDGFYYCIKFEDGEMHYHRLAPADFKARGFTE